MQRNIVSLSKIIFRNNDLKQTRNYSFCLFIIFIIFSNTRVIMKCSFHGDFRKKHFHKRRLIGSRKEKVIDAMINNRTDPSVFVRNEASTLMKEGNIYVLI